MLTIMNFKPYLFFAVAVVLIFNQFGRAVAQDMPGKRDSINSVILNEKRVIQVILPDGYKAGSATKYDVLYITDDWNIKLGRDIQHFIADEHTMPPMIIVGVLNTDRSKDFLPTHNEGNKTSGGADKFLKFFKDELIPYIDKTYPSDGDNTLFGHSFGGVFVTYALLNEPQLFSNYIAGDPSYWWDNGVMLKQVKEKLPSLAGKGKALYIGGREGQGMKEMNINAMDSLLKKDAPAGFEWVVKAYPKESHGTVRLKNMYDGLRFAYSDYGGKPLEFHPSNGIVLKNKPIKIWYFEDTTKVHYTFDGSEPLLTSPVVKPELELTGAAKVTIRQIAGRSKFDKTTRGEFKEGNYLPAKSLKKGYQPGGLHYAYYEGQWDKLPDFKSLKPVKEGVADSTFSIDKQPRQNNFGLVLDGQIEVKQEGYYIFGLGSDDGCKVYLDNKVVIDLDGLHDGDIERSYIVPLKKGFYPLRIEYFQKEGGRKLELVYVTPDNIAKKKITPIPYALQYGQR
ncbi:Predicted hydrolase of the alpha/beta superfamily [Mucilaginibacter gossypiicola]|uniref:Predicted hydrolase of the alpha/beta superfamily n=2 Tax=Mucilaginibacter gossypiicola TaxID=551995 RepID=A0A1H8TZ72_9SPHI|nr:Predicted hydrolase of the alpha/beta superfamily [Mucilaginibacter gossypiicola]